MTTFQDPPLQSRRAVRQSERPDGQQASPFAPPQVPRTAAGAGEPLSYVTQNRPPLPGYEATPAPAPEKRDADAPSTPSFRPRDYSPEARTAPPAWTPEHDRAGVVEYHTQARSAVTPPTSLAASLAGEPSEQTLTRRELRALRDAHGITAAPPTDVQPIVPAAPPAPAPAPQAPSPQPSTHLDSAMAEFDALTRRPAEPAAPASAPGDPALSRRGRRAAAPSEPESPAPAAAEPTPPALVEPAPTFVAPPPAAPVPPVAPTPVASAPEAQAPAAPASAAPVPVAPPPVAPAPVAPTTGERPVGHWTNQSELDEATQVNGTTISRSVGVGSITTSALVLPAIPGQHMDTGEVLLTGSVSLPANLAATGAHHAIDESDLDHLLDPGDHQAVNTDSVPIRAIRAVSSHTNSRDSLIAHSKPHRGNRALTALIVSASGMVVVVVTLLVVALSTEVI